MKVCSYNPQAASKFGRWKTIFIALATIDIIGFQGTRECAIRWQEDDPARYEKSRTSTAFIGTMALVSIAIIALELQLHSITSDSKDHIFVLFFPHPRKFKEERVQSCLRNPTQTRF